MTRNFDEEILIAERQLETAIAQMERVQQDFVAATTQFIMPWYWEQTDSMVKREPEVTKKLGVEKLSQLKADVKELQKKAPEVVTEFIQDENLWWHRKRGNQSYFYHGNRPPDQLDKAVRLVAGRLALVLEKYGYLSPKLQDHEVWREWDSSGNYHLPNARPYYPFGLDWTEQMKMLIKQYEELRIQAPQQVEKVERLKVEKAQSEAADLWSRA